MKLCSTCVRDLARRRQPRKAHQQTTQLWHGTKLNSRQPAVSRVGSYIFRESILLERRVICVRGIKIGERVSSQKNWHSGCNSYYAAAEKSNNATRLYPDNRLIVPERIVKSNRTHLVRTLSGDGGLLDSRLSMACHSLRHDRSLSIRCSQ